MIKNSATKRILIIVGLIAAWFIGNSLFRKSEDSQKIVLHDKQTVQFREVSPQDFNDHISIKGYTKAWRYSTLKARTSGEIKKVHVVSGQRVKKDEVLVELSDDDRVEKLAHAKHEVLARKLEYDALTKLADMEYHSKADMANKKAAYYNAVATEKKAKLELEYAKVRAPFAGVIGSISLDEGTVVVGGAGSLTEVATIAELDPMKVVAFCSNKDVSRVKMGQKAILVIDGIKGEVYGQVCSISPVADNQVRNYRVEIKIANPNYEIADGMAVNGKITTGKVSGFSVPSSAVVLADDGVPGVKVLGDDNKTKFIPVEVISINNDGALISGPQGGNLKLITVGQEYVVDGEEVTPVPEQVRDSK